MLENILKSAFSENKGRFRRKTEGQSGCCALDPATAPECPCLPGHLDGDYEGRDPKGGRTRRPQHLTSVAP